MSTRRHGAGKMLANETLLIDRMLTSLETTGFSGTQVPGIDLEVKSHSLSRFLFEEVDLLTSVAALTGAGAITAVILVLEDVDIMEAAMMDILVVVAVFVNCVLVLIGVERTGCVERKPFKVVVEWLSGKR